jgi:hypothetical protein
MQDAPRIVNVCGQPAWAFDRLSEVGNDSVPPAADLVLEDPQAARPASSNRTNCYDAAEGGVARRDGCLFDRIASFRQAYDECGVVEVAHRSVGSASGEPFEDASVVADGVAACAERQPVQIDRSGNGVCGWRTRRPEPDRQAWSLPTLRARSDHVEPLRYPAASGRHFAHTGSVAGGPRRDIGVAAYPTSENYPPPAVTSGRMARSAPSSPGGIAFPWRLVVLRSGRSGTAPTWDVLSGLDPSG